MVQASKKNISLHKMPPEVSKKEVLKKEVSKNKITNNELSSKKPSIHISFHNPNSEELTVSFLTKVLAQRVVEEMRKGPCR